MDTETDAVKLELPFTSWHYVLDALNASHDYDIAYILGHQLRQYDDIERAADAPEAQ